MEGRSDPYDYGAGVDELGYGLHLGPPWLVFLVVVAFCSDLRWVLNDQIEDFLFLLLGHK